MNGANRMCLCLALLVARVGAADEPGFPPSHVYLGNYPDNDEGGFKDALQGVAHDAAHWYFSNNHGNRPGLFKLPLEIDLGRDVAGEHPQEGIYTVFLDETPLAEMGYHHVGDIDCRDGLIYVPVEGRGRPPVVAVFQSSVAGGDFRYIGHAALAGQKQAGWCAINPVDGKLYSSNRRIHPDMPVYKYRVSVDATPGAEDVSLEPAGTLGLRSGEGTWNRLPEHPGYGWQLMHMQGGVFSSRGHLYLVNGYGHRFDRYKGGIWVFAVDPDQGVATLVDHSSQENQPGTFLFEFHPGTFINSDEPEGIDIWDLDAAAHRLSKQPGGQIHVIMIDNYPDIPSNDDLYFKHYTTAPGYEFKR